MHELLSLSSPSSGHRGNGSFIFLLYFVGSSSLTIYTTEAPPHALTTWRAAQLRMPRPRPRPRSRLRPRPTTTLRHPLIVRIQSLSIGIEAILVAVVVKLLKIDLVPEQATDTTKTFDELRALLRAVGHEFEDGACSEVKNCVRL